MLTEDALSKTIGSVYDTVLDSASWPDVLERIGAAFDCHQVNLVHGKARRSVISFPVDIVMERSYAEHYFKVNVLAQRGKSLAVGTVSSERTLVGRRAWLRSEFRNEFVLPQGIDAGLMSIVERDAQHETVISLWRPRGVDDWERSHFELLARLTPHLRRALSIAHAIDARAAAERSLPEALEVSPYGAILLGPHGRAIFVNRSAEQILAQNDGLTLIRGTLRASRADDHAAIGRAVAAAFDDRDMTSKTGRAVRVSRPSGRRPFVLRVTPLCRGSSASSALVTLLDLEREPRGSATVLREVFGLTLKEAEVALLVVEGRGLRAVAESLGVTLSTVRVHLQRVFEKTQTHRQAELARLLLQLQTDLDPEDLPARPGSSP
jgi:DNA-binding CsgD family transcriptional regulator